MRTLFLYYASCLLPKHDPILFETYFKPHLTNLFFIHHESHQQEIKNRDINDKGMVENVLIDQILSYGSWTSDNALFGKDGKNKDGITKGKAYVIDNQNHKWKFNEMLHHFKEDTEHEFNDIRIGFMDGEYANRMF